MQRYAISLLVSVTVSFGAAGTVSAGAVDEAMKGMKNGMWEMKVFANKVPLLFCVTDTTKIDGLGQTRESMKSLGCKTERDELKGDQYEIVLVCSNANPSVGNFRMVTKGTVRPDYQSNVTTVIGGGPMIKGLFPAGKDSVGESRWLRACKVGEEPGLQEKK